MHEAPTSDGAAPASPPTVPAAPAADALGGAMQARSRSRRAVLRVHRLDRAAFEWTARRRSPWLDRTMPPLTHACDNGSLWAWFSVALALLGGRRGRRAARAGLLSLAIASPVVNGPAKWLIRRPRPVIDVVPELRRIRRTPRTTSFPSGHSASAWCYSVGAASAAPILAPVLVPLAVAISYSRVHTGAHYPGDVIAGALVGAAFGGTLGPPLAELGAQLSQALDDWHASGDRA